MTRRKGDGVRWGVVAVSCFFLSEGVSDDVHSPLCLHQFCGAPKAPQTAVCHGWFLQSEFTECASPSTPASTQSGVLGEADWRRAMRKCKLMRQRKSSRKTEEHESCEGVFNLQKACANSLLCFIRKLGAWSFQGESARKFDKCKFVLVNLVSGIRDNGISVGFEYPDPFSPLWYPFGTVFKRTIFAAKIFFTSTSFIRYQNPDFSCYLHFPFCSKTTHCMNRKSYFLV